MKQDSDLFLLLLKLGYQDHVVLPCGKRTFKNLVTLKNKYQGIIQYMYLHYHIL